MQLRELVNSSTPPDPKSLSAIQNLMQCSLPIRVSYDLRKFIKKVNPLLEAYEETRVQTVHKLGVQTFNEGVEIWTVTPENMEAFTAQTKELLDEEIKDIEIPYITVGMLERGNVSLSVNDLTLLEWLIKEE